MTAGTSYLQIQTVDDATTRVFELGATPVRVGRGIQCEVRLNQVGLGDVQCIIRRRGDEWHFQPVGPPGRTWVDGKPADGQRVLAPGSMIQVGRSTLTIRHVAPQSGGRGSFAAPISVDPVAVEPLVEVARSVQPEPEPRPEPVATAPEEPTSPGAVDDRAKRWQSRLDQRDQWLRDRQSEKRWEARWKAAGETILAKSGQGPGSASPAPTPPPAPESRPEPRAAGPTIDRTMPPRPTPVRSFEPRPVFGHTRRVVDPAAKAPEPALIPTPEPVSTPESVPPQPPVAPVVEPVETAPPTVKLPRLTLSGPAAPPTVEVVIPSSRDFDDVEAALASLPTLDEPVALILSLPVESPAILAPPEPLAATPPEPSVVAEPVALAKLDPVPVGPVTRAVEAAAILEPIRSEPKTAPKLAEVASPPPKPRPQPVAEVRAVPPPVAPESKDWPSAQAIFAAQGTRPTAAAPSSTAKQHPSPEPTEAVRPDSWTVPFWLGWVPSALAVAVLGLFAVGLAVVWVGDGMSGTLAIRLATRPEATNSPIIDPENLPKSAWWRTTASHLAAWALTMERVGIGEDRSADARQFEADARSVSPLGARARFVSEPVPGQEADASASIRLGPTRDVVTLTAMGHRLRRANKRPEAVRAYQAALLTAATTARGTLTPPLFRKEEQVSRYALPHSSLLDPVARDMVDAGDWTPEEWRDATPEFAPAQLAMAAAIRPKDPAEADRRLEAICRGGEGPLDSRFERSEHRAAIAEAQAELGRWADSLSQYQRAIEDETRDLDRRVWWYNLAEVARRHGDEPLRNQAIESAKGLDLSDEVTQRAANAHKLTPDATSTARNR